MASEEHDKLAAPASSLTSSNGSASAEQERRPDRHLLELLVCPITKSTLRYNAKRSELVSHQAQLAFPIVDGIPLLTPEAARTLSDDDT